MGVRLTPFPQGVILWWFWGAVPHPQVRFLEQQNKLLETKWGLLRAQPPPRSSLGGLLEGYAGTLRRQLEGLGQERQRLRAELGHVRGLVEEFKAKSAFLSVPQTPWVPPCLPRPFHSPPIPPCSPPGAVLPADPTQATPAASWRNSRPCLCPQVFSHIPLCPHPVCPQPHVPLSLCPPVPMALDVTTMSLGLPVSSCPHIPGPNPLCVPTSSHCLVPLSPCPHLRMLSHPLSPCYPPVPVFLCHPSSYPSLS